MSYLAKNYNRKKISFKYGKGSYLYSTEGKKYLDFVMGIAVNSLGHANPNLVKAINKQSKKLWHVSNSFIIPEGETLAKKLTKNLKKINVIHLRIEPDAIKHWSEMNKIAYHAFEKLVSNKYIELIKTNINKNIS